MRRSLLLSFVFFPLMLKISGAFWGISSMSRRNHGFPNNGGFLSKMQNKPSISRNRPLFMSGYGRATSYNWTEEAFEIEVTVGPLPRTALAKDIQFKTTPNSVDLRYVPGDDNSSLVLLDGERKLRGRIHVDGTFWAFTDSTDDPSHRFVTVTIEKNIRGPKDDFDVVDYDWKGVYPKDEEEVAKRHYDKPEELNIREYAASMGVDIDNINMSMVDKSMFSSGLNLTQSSLDQFSKAGLINEVTVQGDGSEYMMDPKTGETQPFSQLGFGSDETPLASKKIPFLDTESPWSKTVPVEDIEQHLANKTALGVDETTDEEEINFNSTTISDPIDGLTVKRLKEILKSQGLGTVGNKKDLQERLRRHVQALIMQDKTERNQS